MQAASVNNVHSYPISSSQVRKQPVIDRSSELYKACTDFESIFIKQMLDAMRKTINKDNSLLDNGLGQDMYEDMLYEQYAQKMSSTGQFGLAEMIYSQVSSKS
jgi:peptidoglycan hydrolase FlgJ